MKIRFAPSAILASFLLVTTMPVSAEDGAKASAERAESQAAIETHRDAQHHKNTIRYHRHKSGIDKTDVEGRAEGEEDNLHLPPHIRDLDEERDKAEAEIEELGTAEADEETD